MALRVALMVAVALLLLSERPTEATAPTYFPIGAYAGNPGLSALPAMLSDLAASHLDAVILTGLPAPGFGDYLSVADQTNIRMVVAPYGYLYSAWFSSGLPDTIEAARTALWPLADEARSHPSLLAYDLYDEPHVDVVPKMGLAVQALRERDPGHPAAPILLWGYGAGYIQQESNLPINLIDVYPVSGLIGAPPCALTMEGFSFEGDMAGYIYAMRQGMPSAPLWVILQAFAAPPVFRLPSVEEIRLQHWIALGEGAKGVFWFVWDDLRQQPSLLAEVRSLADRTGPLKPTLLTLSLTTPRVALTGGPAYASTLTNGTLSYVVLANHSCSPAVLTPTALDGQTGRLQNMETGAITNIGQPISFAGGDGGLYALLPAIPTPTATTMPSACSPRPNVQVTVTRTGATTWTVTSQAATPIMSLTFGALQNASTTPPALQGQTATFVATRVSPGPWTVPFTVTDGCGPWRSLAGSGG